MPTPIAPRISLTQNAQADLHALARAHSTPQSLALRARIILRAGEPDSPTNLNIAHDLGCSNLTVGKWRRRYHAQGGSVHMTVVIFGKKNLPSFHTAFNANKIRAEAPKSSNESCSGKTRKRWVRS